MVDCLQLNQHTYELGIKVTLSNVLIICDKGHFHVFCFPGLDI